MFFLPNRLSLTREELFVSFNLAVIPPDMDVISMALHIQLPKMIKPSIVYVNQIIAGWSEESMGKGVFPPRSKDFQILNCSPGQVELIIDVTAYKKKWRLNKKHNHGIYVKFINKNIISIKNKPPYLVIDTI
jgi:hypothetical protein